MTNVPILILAYNRPNKFKNLIGQLKSFQANNIYISIDGPKNEDDQIKQFEIHQLLKKNRSNFKILKINQLKNNVGLQRAVTSGIDWFFENVDAGIILEDDLKISDSLFAFCETLLKRYKNNQQIMMIGGSNSFPWLKHDADYFFSRHAEIWGWATWKRAWLKYQQTIKIGSDLSLNQDPLKSLINITSQKRLKLALAALHGQLDSWAYIWALTLYLNDGLCIVPSKNLVTNVGFGKEATHTKMKTFHSFIKPKRLKIEKHPKEIEAHKWFDKTLMISDNMLVMSLLSLKAMFNNE